MLKRAFFLFVFCLFAPHAIPLIALAAGENSEDPPVTNPYVRTAEIGSGLSRYTDNLGKGNGQFMRLSLVKDKDQSWMFETGRGHRFGETSFGYGVSHGRHVAEATNVSVGLSSGTGDFLAPEYRFDCRMDQGVLKDRNLVLSGGYTRIQSKQENSSDGFGAGAVLWLPHWVLEARFLYDIGQPGDTDSKSWGLGATWYLYKKTYIGAGIDGGEISYMLVGPGSESALVDYDANGWNVSLQQWLTSTGGVNLRYEHGSTSYYQVDGYTFSIFKEF
ncbi:MAG: YaiO family outer membrane beta-barrel protein [Gemmatimonadales bacterium]|nr:YaiO family outer membrane beta-barrel protein [Gemmatimonadales bacterium]